MSTTFFYSLISVLVVSAISLAGALILVIKQHYLKKILLFLVSFAAGGLLGDVFIHLLPEIVEEGGFNLTASLLILAGILLFFILEKILHWRHCHLSATASHHHPLATMNLVGDSVHNLIDGALIAGSYMLSVPVGIATTIAVVLHEIPQEMGDFGVLLHAGMSAKKALFYNFITALTAVFGALIVLILPIGTGTITSVIVPITAGGFLYIANADLIPELHKETALSKSFIQLLSFLAGIGVMLLLIVLE